MKIELRKISNTRHQLRCTRDDGSFEEAELETKSFLVHDFTHLAYELEAELKHGFWGLVASGKTFSELREPMNPTTIDHADELVQTEMIIGPLQSVMQERLSPEQFLTGAQNAFQAHGISTPDFLTIDFIAHAQDRYRKLMGEWTAIAFGETMTIHAKLK